MSHRAVLAAIERGPSFTVLPKRQKRKQAQLGLKASLTGFALTAAAAKAVARGSPSRGRPMGFGVHRVDLLVLKDATVESVVRVMTTTMEMHL